MKKWLTILLSACLLLSFGHALADRNQYCDPIPQAVLELENEDNAEGTYLDCILLKGAPLGDACYVLTSWSLHGYLLQDGAWTMWAQVSPMEQTTDAPLYLRRHTAGAAPGMQGECGLVYPDDLGFDIIRGDPWFEDSIMQMMQFQWMDGDLRMIGWQDLPTGQFTLWEDGQWVYYDLDTGERLGSARIDSLMQFGIMADFDDLPLTLEAAQAMEAITEVSAETLYPGWTMGFYEESNTGHIASVAYYRIDDGLLTIRRVALRDDAADGILWQTDTMPVPLSAALLTRLAAEPVDTLLDFSGYGDTFLTDAAFDTAAIPVADTVIQSYLLSHGLLLMTEDAAGVRRLCWAVQAADGYTVRTSQPLPDGAYLDLFHSSDDEIGLEWNGEYSQCSFSLSADGNWTLGWVTDYSGSVDVYGTVYCGIQQCSVLNTTSDIIVGSHPWHDLFSIDFSQLPASTADAIAGLDRDGWAVVSNPDPADRLHLRTAPSVSAESLGKFYNRTPVQVLEQQGGWSRVRIGLDGHLEGWMMTKYLAFGAAMDTVASASPVLIPREQYLYRPLYASADLKSTTGVLFGSDTWIVGVVGDTLYVLLDANGNTGYLPQSWFWAGNG